MVLGVGGCLQRGVGREEALQAGGVGAAVHVDEGRLAAGVIVLCIRCLRYTMPVYIGAPSTRARCAHAPALKGGKRLLRAICGAGGHGAKIGNKLFITLILQQIPITMCKRRHIICKTNKTFYILTEFFYTIFYVKIKHIPKKML